MGLLTAGPTFCPMISLPAREIVLKVQSYAGAVNTVVKPSDESDRFCNCLVDTAAVCNIDMNCEGLILRVLGERFTLRSSLLGFFEVHIGDDGRPSPTLSK